jgi:hypothetical protein
MKPDYPVYIISKGRFNNCLTAKLFIKENVEFKLVVEPQEAEEYSARYGKERVLVLPFSNLGLGGMPARNWVWEHAKSLGYKRHWILDDNISWMARRYRNMKIRCNSNIALKVVEDFTDRYTNVAISGLNYECFLPSTEDRKPFTLNCHVYSCLLILNELPYRWRLKYNEDTDLCLQVLTNSWCTILVNAFMIKKMRTMVMKGGNTDELYKGDGRLKMARSLEAMWPGIVETKWRYGRPQHVIKNAWKDFKTPLIRRKDIDWDSLKTNEYGMSLLKVKDQIKSEYVQKIYDEYHCNNLNKHA